MNTGMTTGSTSTIYIGQLVVDMYEPVKKKSSLKRGTAKQNH